MKIRPYESKDATFLTALFTDSVRGLGTQDYSPEQVRVWSASAPSPEHYENQARDGRWFLVAVDEHDRPVAYGDLERNGHIDHLYCRPKAAGTGAASTILKMLEAEAVKAGIIHLYVEASEAACRLLLRRGYSIDARRDFEVSGIAIHNFRMTKTLG